MADTDQELVDVAIEHYGSLSNEDLVDNFLWGDDQMGHFARAGEKYPWMSDFQVVVKELVKRKLLTLH